MKDMLLNNHRIFPGDYIQYLRRKFPAFREATSFGTSAIDEFTLKEEAEATLNSDEFPSNTKEYLKQYGENLGHFESLDTNKQLMSIVSETIKLLQSVSP
mmetsp:Transcript_40841/g.46844  ORF Transcript_40841/g.46844 Transcript_40841/m.46844 type:complete len:100 (+) Transcript_40841:657-956(+)